jgi:hypothetical protein
MDDAADTWRLHAECRRICRGLPDNRAVPRLATFYGIVIWMYRPDQWARLHPEELAENWTRAQELEHLVPIEPLP